MVCISNSGNCEVVKVLLSKGADVDAFSYCGTALHIAAIKGQYGAMKILLEHHADVCSVTSISSLACCFVLRDPHYYLLDSCKFSVK
jgi:ankyrin repeat protein